MEANSTDWTPTIIAILSWIVMPVLAHYINTNRDKRNEYNQIIDAIEFLFKEMNEIAFKYLKATNFDTESYYQLIAYNNQLRLLKDRLQLIDKSKDIDSLLIKNIRQITTNDENRDASLIRSLLTNQFEVINSLPKNFNIWFK